MSSGDGCTLPRNRTVDGEGGDSDGKAATASLIALLRRAQLKDSLSLDALISALYPSVVRYVRSRIAGQWDPRTATADIAQETMLRVLTSLLSCRATSDREVMAWCFGITRHVLADVHRSPDGARAQRRSVSLAVAGDALATTDHVVTGGFEHQRGPMHASLEQQSPVAGDHAAVRVSPVVRIVCGGTDYSRNALPLVADPLLRLVLVAYEALPTDTAAIFWSHLIANETWEETGRPLGLTGGAAKRRYQRAQDALRRQVLASVCTLSEVDRQYVEFRCLITSATCSSDL
jgi:DNA-directed RNA polymerase specialized sigma24 family protein